MAVASRYIDYKAIYRYAKERGISLSHLYAETLLSASAQQMLINETASRASNQTLKIIAMLLGVDVTDISSTTAIGGIQQ